jgi:hypothetical protein
MVLRKCSRKQQGILRPHRTKNFKKNLPDEERIAERFQENGSQREDITEDLL